MNDEEREAAEEKERERAEAQKLVGVVIGGKYEIQAFVGGGAMGKVYRAKQMLLDKTVAVKVLHAGLGTDEKFQARFHREAKAASRMDHVNSVGVIDFGIERDGMMFIVMEYLDGRDLFAALRKEWPFSLTRIVDVMGQVLSALAVAHDQGIVHRDLKPENIMLVAKKGDDGRVVDVVKVADFGIAKIVDSSRNADGQRLTTQGMIAGTPEYMSPEQAQARDVDGRSDLYSCGIILYEMATGKLPFESETAIGVVLQHVTSAPPAPHTINANIDPQLEAIILKSLEKDPAKRFADAREMRSALKALVGNVDTSGAGVETGASSTGTPSFVNAATAMGTPAVPSVVMRASGLPAEPKPTANPAPVAGPTSTATEPKESIGVERITTQTGIPAPSSERVGTSGVTHEVPVPIAPAKKGIAPATVGASLVAALAIGALAMNSLRDRGPSNANVGQDTTQQRNAQQPPTGAVPSNVVDAASAQMPANSVVEPVHPEVALLADAGAGGTMAATPPTEHNPARNGRVLAARDPSAQGAHPTGTTAPTGTTPVQNNVPTTGTATTGSTPTTTVQPSNGTGTTAPNTAQNTANPATNTTATTTGTAPTNTVVTPPPVAALTRVAGSVVDVRASNGVLVNRLQGRAQTAVDTLSRCVLNHGRTGHPEFNAPLELSMNIAVVERRLDRLRLLGAPSWVQACAHEAEPAFAGDLPEADDPEYTITIRVTLSPQR